MNTPSVSIVSVSSLSPMGFGPEAVREAYRQTTHSLSALEDNGGSTLYGGRLAGDLKGRIEELRNSETNYRSLDPTVWYAIAASRDAVKRAGWTDADAFGVNLGSSRGATTLFEEFHKAFMRTGQVGTHASPSTTLGNLASWVAQDLGTTGPELSHSITCSTALHALVNGIAWIRAGLSQKFLVGGSEAPITDFTLAQMQALKIYSRESGSYPCRALDLKKANNTMVLGEGAAVACLESGNPQGALAIIDGVGYATEPLRHGASLSADAACLQRSMRMALGELPPGEIDVVVMHAPGTLKGDRSEYKAIEKVFGNRLPALTTNKWKIGHTLGASGLFSLEMALIMLRHKEFIGVPYLPDRPAPGRIRNVMVNAVGFGGNAVSIVVRSTPGS